MRSAIKNSFSGVMVAALAFLVCSCQSSSPATRIQENPALYQSLPQSHQLLVSQGRIENGMSPQAVYLAWGAPNAQPYVGQQGKKRLERWVYTRLQPVMVMHDWYGPRRGPYGWYDDFGPDTAYVPQKAATVTFENGKVVSWEALQP